MVRVVIVVFFSAMLSMIVHAGELKVFTFSDGVKPYTVKTEWDHRERIAVSTTCRLNVRKSCLALQRLNDASVKNVLSKRSQGSANPGTLICGELGGQVVIGRDPNGNENSFCKFPDQSLIDCGTLTWFGRNK